MPNPDPLSDFAKGVADLNRPLTLGEAPAGARTSADLIGLAVTHRLLLALIVGMLWGWGWGVATIVVSWVLTRLIASLSLWVGWRVYLKERQQSGHRGAE